MPSLTSLPLSLQSRILFDVCDMQVAFERTQLYGTNYYLPARVPWTQISLEGVHTVQAPLFSELLAPALASPVLAYAAANIVPGDICYLTDVNTEGRLPEWVKAFSPYVRAVSISDSGKVWKRTLPKHLRRRMASKLCCNAVDLFREITLNDVRLEVLDVVHVPFNERGDARDAMMTGLCSALESCQSTLRELALPVYLKSDLCARALKSATLPHLTVFSIELKDKHSYRDIFSKDSAVLAAVFLRMMEAVDGHADRSKRLTTLRELRLINLYDAPCTKARDSGCSVGFFRAIKTLRVSGTDFVDSSEKDTFREIQFFCLFAKLKALFWTGEPSYNAEEFESLCQNLKEVHLCQRRWIKRVQLGAKRHTDWALYPHRIIYAWAYEDANLKIKTLASETELLSADLRIIWTGCPNLENFSLYLTPENVYKLGELIQNCKRLSRLEIIIHEEELGRLGANGWQEIGNAIPRRHEHLNEIAIQTKQRGIGKVVPVDTVVKCFLTVVKRMGMRTEKLLFRAMVKIKTIARALNAICSIMDSCGKRMWKLTHLQVEMTTCNNTSAIEDPQELLQARINLQVGQEELTKSQFFLEKLDVSLWSMDKSDGNTHAENGSTW